MPCGMELRRVRNRRAIAIIDAYGDPVAPGATGDVDPHDEDVLAGLAAGDLDDLGPGAAVRPHTHAHAHEEAH
jgi:hypothetical protein